MGGRTAVAAIVSAAGVAATSICCLPVVAALFGAAGASTASLFAPLRTFFILATLGMISFALVQVYRPIAATGVSCQVRSRTRERLLVWFLAVLSLVLLSINWWASWLIYIFL